MNTQNKNRKLDAWIAEHVMGWKRCREYDRHNGKTLCFQNTDYDFPVWIGFLGTQDECLVDHPEKEMWHPTNDPTAAMEVLKKCLAVAYFSIGCPDDMFRIEARFFKRPNITIEARTLELAICLFAKNLFTK